jgi:hypothetical protein
MGYILDSNGLEGIFEKRWNSSSKDKTQFPQNFGDFIEGYKIIASELLSKIHPAITTGAAQSDGIALTDHGYPHVKMVMDNSLSIIPKEKLQLLNGCELLLLLLAIQFHDVGNITGRKSHEKKISEVMTSLKKDGHFPFDSTVERIVQVIAESHSGQINTTGDKDTLRTLYSSENCLGVIVRPAVLASILRLADEFADDKSRTNAYLSKNKKNEVHHAYSETLQPIVFDSNTARMDYCIPFEKIIKPIKIKGGTKYLYDEILSRLKKCMCEIEYCRKYSEGFIGISALQVHINIIKDKKQFGHPRNYSLRLSGYPNLDKVDIINYLENRQDFCIDGETLKSEIEMLKTETEHTGSKKEV